ncbi:MAG: putative peptidoglycan bound protein, partial [Arthrobacter sp.]|nr:putative peptidoglycan bound protein [Arthrobacter sp.]
MSIEQELTPLSDDELMAEAGTALPDKEVASVLDLNADLDLGINAA